MWERMLDKHREGRGNYYFRAEESPSRLPREVEHVFGMYGDVPRDILNL